MDTAQIFMAIALIFLGSDLFWLIYLIGKRLGRSKLDNRRRQAIRRLIWSNGFLFVLLFLMGVMFS
jgi:hypothetical protein